MRTITGSARRTCFLLVGVGSSTSSYFPVPTSLAEYFATTIMSVLVCSPHHHVGYWKWLGSNSPTEKKMAIIETDGNSFSTCNAKQLIRTIRGVAICPSHFPLDLARSQVSTPIVILRLETVSSASHPRKGEQSAAPFCLVEVKNLSVKCSTRQLCRTYTCDSHKGRHWKKFASFLDPGPFSLLQPCACGEKSSRNNSPISCFPPSPYRSIETPNDKSGQQLTWSEESEGSSHSVSPTVSVKADDDPTPLMNMTTFFNFTLIRYDRRPKTSL
ncbi:unnamed protein product [Victoria cruziana]